MLKFGLRGGDGSSLFREGWFRSMKRSYSESFKGGNSKKFTVILLVENMGIQDGHRGGDACIDREFQQTMGEIKHYFTRRMDQTRSALC